MARLIIRHGGSIQRALPAAVVLGVLASGLTYAAMTMRGPSTTPQLYGYISGTVFQSGVTDFAMTGPVQVTRVTGAKLGESVTTVARAGRFDLRLWEGTYVVKSVARKSLCSSLTATVVADKTSVVTLGCRRLVP